MKWKLWMMQGPTAWDAQGGLYVCPPPMALQLEDAGVVKGLFGFLSCHGVAVGAVFWYWLLGLLSNPLPPHFTFWFGF